MAVGDLYITEEQIRSAHNIGGVSDSAEIKRAIRAASRAIDEACHRVFYDTVTATARRFPVIPGSDSVRVDDFHTLAAVSVDRDTDRVYEEAVVATDYLVEPVNPKPGWPYTELVLLGRPLPASRWPLVEVTAVWGWAEVPAQIEQAAQLIARKLLERRKSPDAIAQVGSNQGVAAIRVASTDPDAQALLAPFVRYTPVIG